MRHSGTADLPLHYGKVPPWLAQRMARLGGAIVEAVVMEYGLSAFLERISHPAWFQSLGCVLGMDWHSSGITTSVMGALKKALNPRAAELGIYICGGRGQHSRDTPAELLRIAGRTGLDGDRLVHCSRLAAKVDNTAIQDGFQLYLHSFILTREGEWAVVQQGMNGATGLARRYHWHSAGIRSFTDTPHAAVFGRPAGHPILNLVDHAALPAQQGILQTLTEMPPEQLLSEIPRMRLPAHHDVRAGDVNLKRLGAVLALAQAQPPGDFSALLLLPGVGPRTLQSLTLVSEVIHGTPSRFRDPARFSFAHGGKDGHPFPVPLKTYDETISVLETGIRKARIGDREKQDAIHKLHGMAQEVEKEFVPNERFGELVERERRESYRYGGRTVMGKAQPPGGQLSLFT
ncbi:DUF763 domain-containing protein [Compostibacter hankyongensis]|uniref:DUF763 domain-containing protein n=1 Tax=Compostibacter hankyongensis TaxID=1007089 RepID=A0ABP8FKJ3_9BACT